MSYDAINAALFTKLAALTPVVPIAWPNVNHIPQVGVPYMRAATIPYPTSNPTMGAGDADVKRYFGLLQVLLYYPLNSGEGDLRRKADAVIAWFYRGLTLTSGGVSVHIDATPYASPAFVSDAWFVVPVNIPYRSDVY